MDKETKLQKDRERSRRWFNNNKDKHRTRRRRNYFNRRQVLDNIKLSAGCADCGYKEYAAALDFDHRPEETKSFGIAKCWGKEMSALLEEIAKCDIVCANCHRVRTWKRLQTSLKDNTLG